jgi:putative solute:sodium symporter small subunit
MNSQPSGSPPNNGRQNVYWAKSLQIVLFILTIWFVVSLGCGVLFRENLDAFFPPMGGAPFGFWMAQQGAIIVFLLLLFLYMILMNSLDRKSGFDQEGEE